MKTSFIAFVLGLFFSTIASAEPPIRVIDGDTFARGEYRYRIWGIDAPEKADRCPDGYPAGREATKLLVHLLANDIVCSDLGRDGYGRVITQCVTAQGGYDIAAMMVAAGFAWDWPRYSNGRYAHWQIAARDGQRGVWGHGCRWRRF